MTNGQAWRPFRLSDSEAQKRLEALALAKRDMDADAFAHDASRVETLSGFEDCTSMRPSKGGMEVKDALLALGEEADLSGAIADLFGGVKLNTTEGRAVLHMALRGEAEDGFEVDGQDVMPEVLAVRGRMLDFVDKVHALHAKGEVTDVVNIGIGGSDLGPAMAVKALRRFSCGPQCHFVSNVDGAHVASVLQDLDPQTTMIVVVSKTFTTQETMANARIAKSWLEAGGGTAAKQLVAVSTNLEGTRAFGISEDQTFGFENWVGGRYSMWGPVGVCIALSIGSEHFKAFLAGARAVDQHMRHTSLEENVPVFLALLGHWNQNALGFRSHAVLPYAEDLGRLPAYLQQADMESNGKFVGRDGKPVSWNTGAVVWGEPGTNSQHAFFQLLHQGTEIHPVDFVAFKAPTSEHEGMHRMLLANALARGGPVARAQGPEGEPHRFFPKQVRRSSCSTPCLQILGHACRLHEHRIFVRGCFGASQALTNGGRIGQSYGQCPAPRIGRYTTMRSRTNRRRPLWSSACGVLG